MFEKDQLIMCGGHGVCRVVNVTGNPFDRFDKVRRFYVLEPVFEKASTVYMPVDNEKVVMRRVMNREEAEELCCEEGTPGLRKKRTSYFGNEAVEYTISITPEKGLVFKAVIRN